MIVAKQHCGGVGYSISAVCLANDVNVTLKQFQWLTILYLSEVIAHLLSGTLLSP